MKIYFLLLIFLIPQLVHAELLDARRAELDFVVQGSVTLRSNGGYSEVDYLEAILYWFPRNSTTQDVLSFSTSPTASFEDNHFLYRWNNPNLDTYEFSVNANVLTNSDYVEVSRIINFPLKRIPNELVAYTQPQEIIDLNDDIRAAAASVASGKNDLYEIVVGLAEYSRNNVEYELSTLTVSASQKSSWVLENKRGVCDELTGLFISMARSLGIPAKFVSGVSYTNLEEFDDPWQAHGWAEVYFPEVGWIPFDVTYGEYGWLDSSHVKLRESLDADRNAAEFRSRGKNYKISGNSIDLDTNKINDVGRPVPSADITIDPVWNGIGFGSYNVIKVQVSNPHNYYVTDNLNFARVPGMELLLPESTHFMLKPYETKEFRYLAKITEDLNMNSRYSFPLQITTGRQVQSASSFRVEPSGRFYDRSVAERLLDLTAETSGFGNLLCKPEREFVYINNTVMIDCSTSQKNVDICFLGECKQGSANFEFKPEELGFTTLEIKMLDKNELVASSFINIEVLEDSSLTILEIGSPDIDYGGLAPLKLKFQNKITIEEMNITLEHPTFDASQTLQELPPNVHELTINVNTANLLPGENTIVYHMQYTDKYGTLTEQEEQVTFLLNNSPWHHKFWGWLVKNLGKVF